MADVSSSIFSLVGLITDTAAKAKVNKRSCRSLARHVEWAETELKKASNIETASILSALHGLLQECLEDLQKFANPHGINRFLKGPVSKICVNHQTELIAWVDRSHAQEIMVSRATDPLPTLLEATNSSQDLSVTSNNGDSIPQDLSKVMEWFLKAANQGDTSAQFNLGLMYRNGDGVPILTCIPTNKIAAFLLRTTVRYIFRRTPKGVTLREAWTISILRMMMSLRVLNVAQSRKMMNFSNAIVHLRTGTFKQSSKDQWATKVKGQGWEGFWIPFKDQLNKDRLQQDLAKKHTAADIGTGCDIVMLAIHGGGMVLGDALMFLGNYRSWMKGMQKNHNIKIGVLSVEYSLSPEVMYPGALNECVAAYRHLVEHQGVDPRRIVMCGDSAGGNLCLTTALKIRDEYAHLGMPAGQVLFSPWVMCPKPLKDSADDYITNLGGRTFAEAYTQNSAKIQTSPYAAPIRAPTLEGMPKMLIFAGGIETLRPSIEGFVIKAKSEGVDVDLIVKEGRAHDYALIEEISGPKVIHEAEQLIGQFVARIRDAYIGLATAI
ncbi:hypothetical protein BGZ83_010218 [Gryganskiella cystojenkinii]|nr:hypothetical protein BGZ83_010218 [Gryganskiella cystojenkinii]